ncbi:MAG: hypothetical protein ACP5JL_07525 [bacterium]
MKGIEKVLESRILFLLILALSLFYLFTPIRIGYNIYDEGIVVYGANRVFNGEIPYRDFWTMYAPGQFYMVALLYRLFGIGLFPVRVYSAVINFLIAVLAYLIVRRFAGHKIFLLYSLSYGWEDGGCFTVLLRLLGHSGVYLVYSLWLISLLEKERLVL